MRITTIVENRPSPTDSALPGEWGLSLNIQYAKGSILFDTGASALFAQNAQRLAVDIGAVDAVVLSHHHYDHGGGLRRFFEINSQAKLYLAREPKGEGYIKIFGLFKKYIGLEKTLLQDRAERCETVEQTSEILPNVFVIPEITQRHPQPLGNRQIVLDNSGEWTADDFSHELIMVIKDQGELVVFTGCSHNGILNMLDTVADTFPGTPIKAIVGGLHLVTLPPLNLMASSRHEIEALGRKLLDFPIGTVYTGHCTGARAYNVLKSVMGDRIKDLQTGTVLTWGVE